MKILIKMKLQLLFMLLTAFSYAQVGINTATPEESSVLELSSDDKALLLTRLDDENSITNPVDGMIYYDKDLNCFRGRANGVWVDFEGCTGSTPPTPPLPGNVTLTAGQIRFIASVNDDDYLPYTAPTGPAAVGALAAGGGTETLVDIQGVLTTTGISVLIPYENTNSSNTTIDAFSQTVSVPVTLQEGGTESIDVELSYPQTVLPMSSEGNLTATIRAVTTELNVVKLDINKGIGGNALGVLLAEFTIATDDSSGTGPIQLRALPGILDRNFADADHQFLYLPVVAEDGNTWLNNNLGAHYADVNHPSFNPAQQATAFNDHLAYGSLYQWGRLSDGHELITWKGANTGTAVNGTTSTNATTDTPANALFVTEASDAFDWRNPQNDSLWQGEVGTNNPCPVGYRLPIEAEQAQLVTDASITTRTNAASSNLAFTTAGFRRNTTGVLTGTNVGSFGFYWSSTIFFVTSDINYSRYLFFTNSAAGNSSNTRARGYSVRCIQD